MRLGKVVKSNSHCDYVVQLDDEIEVLSPPKPDDYGFGCFVKLETQERHWAVGLVYNSQLFNPMYLNVGPRLLSEPDPLFTPDLVRETRTLLWTVLIGTLGKVNDQLHGQQGIPRVVVPVNTLVYTMDRPEVYSFHLSQDQRPQFHYYSHVLKSAGSFAPQLVEQILREVSQMFVGADRRAWEVLCKELVWKHTVGIMR